LCYQINVYVAIFVTIVAALFLGAYRLYRTAVNGIRNTFVEVLTDFALARPARPVLLFHGRFLTGFQFEDFPAGGRTVTAFDTGFPVNRYFHDVLPILFQIVFLVSTLKIYFNTVVITIRFSYKKILNGFAL